ncbi:unnamed protein product [Cylicostephanus goldi]|uniref:Uncharacterized protein n=1 Tax=Cylicostephanus goldi TaxID=71465 RepID=A0A3P6QUP7_CYLGO|nr:unnamed protein product [Cylicostephanus goldi]
MDTTEKKKIFFEEADRPPPSYYDDSLERMPLKKIPFQTPDPESKIRFVLPLMSRDRKRELRETLKLGTQQWLSQKLGREKV